MNDSVEQLAHSAKLVYVPVRTCVTEYFLPTVDRNKGSLCCLFLRKSRTSLFKIFLYKCPLCDEF